MTGAYDIKVYACISVHWKMGILEIGHICFTAVTGVYEVWLVEKVLLG